MANLLGRTNPYLHSQSWTFINYYKNYVNTNDEASNAQVVMDKARTQLENLYSEAKITESQFYADFGVKDNFEWAQKYLKSDSKDASVFQIVQYIIDSEEMYAILLGKSNKLDAKSRYRFEDLAREATRVISEDLFESKEFNDLITQTAINLTTENLLRIGEKFRGISDGAFREWQKGTLGKMLERRLVPNSTESYLQDRIDEIFKKYKMVDNSTQKAKIKEAVDYLKTQMANRGVQESIITAVAKEWRTYLESGALSNRLLSGENNNIVGSISEVAPNIAKVVFTLPDGDSSRSQYKVAVEEFGTTKIKRFGSTSTVSAKTDNIWRASPNGRAYRIQYKNSLTTMDEEEIVFGEEQDRHLGGRPVQLKLNDESKLSTLEDQLLASGIYNEEDLKVLSYLLVNTNVLSNQGLIETVNEVRKKDGRSTSRRLYKAKPQKVNPDEPEIKPVLGIQAKISQILTGAVRLFCSDFFGEDNELPTMRDRYEFIVYKGKYLIPMSDIYQSLLYSMEEYFNQVARIWITSQLKSGYTGVMFADLWTKKLEAIQTEDKDAQKDYHLPNLVEEGKKGGAQVFNLIKINGIRLNIFDPQSYLSKGLKPTLAKYGL